MLIHVNDAVTLQGARALRQPLIIPYGIHQEYELQIVTGHDNRPVDVESRGCVKWTLTITPSPENPTTVLAYAVFAENIAAGSYLRFDFAATSVEMYKHVAGNPATPAVLQLQGFTEEDAPATLVITLPVALVTTAQQRLPVDLSTALMQELQLAVSVVGAAQRQISKYAGDTTDAAERAEQAAIHAHASEVNAQGSATAAGVSAGNARESELAAETAQEKAETAQGKAEDAQTAAETAQSKAEDAQSAAETAQGKAEDAQDAAEAAQTAAETAQGKAETAEDAAEAAQTAAETAQGKAETAQGKAEDAQAAAEAAQIAAETTQGKAEAAQTAAETAQGKAEDAQTAAETAQGKAEDAQQAAETAQGAAETAQGKAEDAQTAAETAQGKAEDAQSAAETAQGAAETAQGKAEDAQSAAETAQGAAETAQGKAEDAQQAAEDAQSAAETAQGAAETAQGKAEDAQTAAETAQTAAETAQGKAEDAQDAAEAAQTAAETAQTAAAASAKLSESWAKGDTGVRDGENTNNAKYYAELSEHFSPVAKADKVVGATAGDVAGLDAEGNLTDTGIPADNVAQQDGYYKDMTVGQAENLVDVNATPSAASFDFRTTAGDVSIDEHGVATVDQINGSTEVQNQLVAPTNENTASGNGSVQVTDAVAGAAKSVLLQGDAVVKNQLVPDTEQPKDASSTDGLIQVQDAVEGSPRSLAMYGDAWVRNQFVDWENANITSSLSSRYASLTLDRTNRTATLTIITGSSNNGIAFATALIQNHVYLFHGKATSSVDTNRFQLGTTLIFSTLPYMALTANNATMFSFKATISSDTNNIELFINKSSSAAAGSTLAVSDFEIADLTQLCNGDATKIAAIQTWDDLVAAYPEYAQYVAYNTGTVVGLTPTLQVNNGDGGTMTASAPLFGIGTARDSEEGIGGSRNTVIGSYTFTGQESWGKYSTTAWVFALQGKAIGPKNVITSDYITVEGAAKLINYSYSCCGNSTGSAFYIHDVDYPNDTATPSSFAAHMAGKTIYFELATPAQSSVTPSQITLQDGDNVVMQTDGGRTADFTLNYDSLNVSVPLLANRTYLLNDDGVSSIVTGQTAQAAVAGVDQIVDLTQMFNGDATRIASITDWVGLVALLPEYASRMAYNAGEIVGSNPTWGIDGQTISPSAPLFAAGTVYDSEDVVAGKRTQRIGSYTFTGNEAWNKNGNIFFAGGIIQGYNNCAVIPEYVVVNKGWAQLSNRECILNNNVLYFKNDAYSDLSSWKTYIAGKTIYYALATPVVTDITPTPVTLQAGTNVLTQTSGDISATHVSLTYAGTNYSIQTNSPAKYLKRIDGEDSIVTGVTSIAVVGGRDKLIDLTRWFGMGKEPATVDAFYALYPLWKGYDIPYIEGSILNFKGTAIKSVFFNAYNHETGTAELLGGNQYQICGTYTAVSYTDIWGDEETLSIDSDGIFTPVNNGTLTVTGGNDTDTCVHLTWSGYKNFGTDGYKWEPYGESVRALDVSTYFPQGMNGFDRESADELHADKVVRRVGSYTFTGNEYMQFDDSWRPVTGCYTCVFSGALTTDYNYAGIGSNGMRVNWAFAPLESVTYGNGPLNIYGTAIGIAMSSNRAYSFFIRVPDYIASNKTEMLAWLAGKTVYYELAPEYVVTTQISPELNLSYTADDFGTEWLLPRNTTTLRTTMLDGLIKYNLDFTRLGVHLSEMYPELEDFYKNNAKYARTDGYYKSMTVGLAENLIDVHADGEERLFQRDTACGETSISDDGTATVQVMKGSTVMWNQLAIGGINTSTNYDVVEHNGVWTLTVKPTTYGLGWQRPSTGYANHLYLFCFDAIKHDVDWAWGNVLYCYKSVVYSNESVSCLHRWVHYAKCVEAGTNMVNLFDFYLMTPTFAAQNAGVRISFKNFQLFDLTQMFGFGREPRTYDEFLLRFPDPAYPAEESRTVHFNGTDIQTVGFNQLDPSTDHIRVLPQAYQLTGGGTLNFYDTELPSAPVAVTYGSTVEPFGFYKNGDKWYRALLGIADYDSTRTYRVNDGVVYNNAWYKCNTQIDTAEEFDAGKWTSVTLEEALADNFLFTPLFIEPDADGIFTPPTRGWLYYANTTSESCLHFTWSGYRNGEYEDFWKEQRVLQSAKYFPDGMRGSRNISTDEYVYDELQADKAVQRFGVYTFTGTEAWVKSSGTPFYWDVYLSSIPSSLYDSTTSGKVFTTRIDGLTIWTSGGGLAAMVNATNGSNMVFLPVAASTLRIGVRVDSCDTLEKIQTFMAGRKMYYPLKNPVVTPIDPPLNLTYKVADFGIEQLVPVADISMQSTAFEGVIRYSTDFTRELVHIVDENVRGRVDNLEDIIVQKADKDGVYNQLTAGNAYNLIDRHAEGTDRQIGYDTSCGTASISDDGSAEIQELRGSTIQLQNLVADEYQNIFQTGEGYVELPYAYGGEVQPLLFGRTYVPNQQVPDEGEQQDIALWSDHYYYTNIGGVEDIVTGLSTITVTPGTDKVTDLTQMFFPGHEPSTVEEMRTLYPAAGTGAYSAGAIVGVKHSVWTTPVFNQGFDVRTGEPFTVADVLFTPQPDGTITMVGTCSVQTRIETSVLNQQETRVPGHKYMLVVGMNIQVIGYKSNAWANIGASGMDLWTQSSNSNSSIGFLMNQGDVYDGVLNLKLVDLTLMFGAGHEPATASDAIDAITALGKDMSQYQPYDATGTPIGGTIDLSDSDLELHGWSWLTSANVNTNNGLDFMADSFDPANSQLIRATLSYTFTGVETSWTKVTDATYPNGYYYRYDTNTHGQIAAEGANKYPYLMCSSSAFAVAKQGGVNQFEHSISVSAQRYICVCTVKTLDELKAEIAGVSVVYRRASWSVGTQSYGKPLPTTPAGGLPFRQIAGTVPVHIARMYYNATEYDVRLTYATSYWLRHDGVDSVVRVTNHDTYQHVVAGQDQLAQLEGLLGNSLANSISYVEDLFRLYPYLKTLARLPYGGPIINFKGNGIKTVGFNLLNITAEQGDLTGWATTNVPRKFEEGKFYVGFKADNTINTAYAQFVSASASQVNFKSRNYYGLLYPMRCFPDTQYQFTGTRNATNQIRNRMVFYDIDGAWISAIEYNDNANDSALFTTPENAYWMCLLLATSDSNLNATRYETDPCVHLTWSGYRNGDYETYWEETRDLPVAERFPEGMNGFGSTYDTMKSAGTVQNFNAYVFSDANLTWYSQSKYTFYIGFNAMYSGTAAKQLEGMQRSANYFNNTFMPSNLASGVNLLVQVPGVRTLAQIKEWLRGRHFIYRRALPDPIPYDEPVNLIYKVADFGTEQMVPDNPTDAMPTTTALNAIIRYNSDMARTITKLPKDYQSQDSMDELNAQLGAFIGGTISKAWDATDGCYKYTFTRIPTVETLSSDTATLQPNKTYTAAPTGAATYTLAVPTDLTVDNDITVDLTWPSSGGVTFKQGTATLPTQKAITPAAGSKWRFLCCYIGATWCVFPIEIQ